MNSQLGQPGDGSDSDERLTTRFAPTSQEVETVQGEEPAQLPGVASRRYELGMKIAHGGMGVIYQAQDLVLQREVAVKVLRAKYLDDRFARRKFENEARVMSFLPHPGLPPIYDCGACDDGRPFYVMKLIKGVTLSHLLKTEKPSEQESFKIFSDVCEAVAYAHSREVVHLDLKPENVMVGAFGEVHVMDWGLARIQHNNPFIERVSNFPVVQPGEEGWGINGTPQYMAPEQALGEDLDARTDVFGLGAILCHILIGQPPYSGSSVEQIFQMAANARMDGTLQALHESTSDHSLIRLAVRCLSPHKSDRPKNAIAVAKEVERYQQSALELARSDMSRFFELTLDLFCIAGLDGYFRRINANFSRVLGHSEKELLSRPFLEFVHPKDRPKTIAQMALLREGKPVVRFRNRYLASDGSYIFLEWMAKAIEQEGIVFAVARDVSDSYATADRAP
ncbi:MAG: protein kinase [bacterium]|nr:protein kinase [bacterium]